MRNAAMLSWFKVNKMCRLNILRRIIWVVGGTASVSRRAEQIAKSKAVVNTIVFQTLGSEWSECVKPIRYRPNFPFVFFLFHSFERFPKCQTVSPHFGLQCFLSRPGLSSSSPKERHCVGMLFLACSFLRVYTADTHAHARSLALFRDLAACCPLSTLAAAAATTTRVSKQRASTRFVSHRTDGGANKLTANRPQSAHDEDGWFGWRRPFSMFPISGYSIFHVTRLG